MKPADQQNEAAAPTEEEEAEKQRILELVDLCGKGDAAALKQFFEEFAEDIYNFPIKVFHLDQDAASDFFLYAFERLKDGGRFGSFQGRSSFRTWFYTVLRNLVIDWMRTIREVDTVQVSRSDERGHEHNLVENTPDPRSLDMGDQKIVQAFQKKMLDLPVELRSVFKLSYIYYLDLSPDELQYISERSGKDRSEILATLADLKHMLSEKEIKNLGAEDKITSLYLAILELKQKKEKLLAGSGGKKVDPEEIERVERSIEKKYQQREKLLVKKSRGHFIVRVPYRYIAELLDIPEGSVSVQMMRALDRVRGGLVSESSS